MLLHPAFVPGAAAHNKISGTLPAAFEAMHFTELDLSFNRITGKYRRLDVAQSVVTLQVNRLSGPLPSASSFSAVEELAILRDNMFGCQHVPSEDEYSEDYSCGSQYLDFSLFLFAGIVSGYMLVLLV